MTAVRQRNVALILARELAVNLSTPMWIWDEQGELIYYNEHAKALLGGPQHELGVGRLDELPKFEPTDLDGNPIPLSEIPSAVVIERHVPAHRELRIVALDGVKRVLTVTAFPLFARGGEFVGVVSVFWELSDQTTNGRGDA